MPIPVKLAPLSFVLCIALLWEAGARGADFSVDLNATALSLFRPKETYPAAFKGLGVVANANVYFVGGQDGAGVLYFKQGKGSVFGLNYLYFLTGRARTRPVISSLEEATKIGDSAVNDLRYVGIELFAGPDVYVVSTDGSTGKITTVSGFGYHAGIAAEFPFILGLTFRMAVGFFGSAGGPTNIVVPHAGLGLPLRF